VRQDGSPLTAAANFLRYVREGFYSGTVIHAAVANFVIQGARHDATATLSGRRTKTCSTESATACRQARHRGMARGDAPHSGNAQFYVNLVDNPDLDPVSTRWGYTVFGRIVQGMDVIDHIGETPTGSIGPFKSDAPLKPVHHREDGDGPRGCDQQRAGDNPAAAAAGHDPLAEVSAWRDCSSRTCI